MCLAVFSYTPIRVKFINGKATLYKVLDICNKELKSPYQGIKYVGGWNKASGNLETENEYGRIQINGGAIHVCYTLKAAKIHCEYHSKIVEVICYEKDFIAESDDGEACFKKVWLSKVMKDAALKSKKKRVIVEKNIGPS